MLLLDKDDKGSSRASLLALDASSSTGSPTIVNVPPPTATRLSRRLILIHLLHLLLLAISLTILIVGVLRLDEDVSVSFANVSCRIPPFLPLAHEHRRLRQYPAICRSGFRYSSRQRS